MITIWALQNKEVLSTWETRKLVVQEEIRLHKLQQQEQCILADTNTSKTTLKKAISAILYMILDEISTIYQIHEEYDYKLNGNLEYLKERLILCMKNTLLTKNKWLTLKKTSHNL